MHFLAGSVLLFAFMAFARGETCNQITECVKHAQNIQSAAESGNMDAMCTMQKKMVDCFSSALADCQSSGSSIPQASLNQFQNTMSQARTQYEKACAGRGGSSGSGGEGDGGMTYNPGSEGSVPETASCLDAAKCAFDIMKVQKAMNENRLKEVCAIVIPSAKCMKSAFNDCKKKNLLAEQQLNAMSEQVTQVDSILGEHCGSGMSVSFGSASGNTVDSMATSVACADAGTCMPDSDKLVDAITNSRHEEACNILTESHTCLKAAIEDCTEKNIITGTALQSMQDSLKGYEPQLAQYCQSPTGDVHCMAATSCIPDTDRLTDASMNGRHQEACQILTDSTSCLQSVVDDCKARGMMSETELQHLEQIKSSYEPQIQQLCQSSPTGGVGCFQMQTCTPDTNKLNRSIENKQYEEACSIMKPAMECQKSAMEDCKNRGILDSSSIQEMEHGVALAQEEMKRYCSSGNSASMSVLHIFLAPVWVFLINFMSSRM